MKSQEWALQEARRMRELFERGEEPTFERMTISQNGRTRYFELDQPKAHGDMADRLSPLVAITGAQDFCIADCYPVSEGTAAWISAVARVDGEWSYASCFAGSVESEIELSEDADELGELLSMAINETHAGLALNPTLRRSLDKRLGQLDGFDAGQPITVWSRAPGEISFSRPSMIGTA